MRWLCIALTLAACRSSDNNAEAPDAKPAPIFDAAAPDAALPDAAPPDANELGFQSITVGTPTAVACTMDAQCPEQYPRCEVSPGICVASTTYAPPATSFDIPTPIGTSMLFVDATPDLGTESVMIGAVDGESAYAPVACGATLDVVVSLGGVSATTMLTNECGAGTTEQVYVKPSPLAPATAAARHFGAAVALDGDTLAVGSTGDGLVTILVRDDTTWSVQSLIANAAAGFGASVALSGDTLVAGAPHDGGDVGTAFVYTRDDAGTWTLAQTLTDPFADAGDLFGTSVAVDVTNGVLAVGTPETSVTAGDQIGVVWTYTFGAGMWNQTSNVKENGSVVDEFGAAVATAGGLVVGAAPYHTPGDALESGAVYVETPDGAQVAQLTAPTPVMNGNFGASVAIDGERIVVGEAGTGHAYVFVQGATTSDWTVEGTLAPSSSSALFGTSVGVAGETVVVGAPGDDGVDAASGAAFLFFLNPTTTWTQSAYLKAPFPGADDAFGGAVTISADTVVIGATGEASDATGLDGDATDDSDPGAGAVYIFQ